MLPAAGLSTRHLPAAKAQPKAMFPVVDKPAIQYVVEEAVEAGMDDILIVTGRGNKAIEDHFDRAVELELALEEKNKHDLLEQVRALTDLARVHYVRQREARGLGHAVGVASNHVGREPFAVLLPDDLFTTPVLQGMIDVFERTGRPVLALMEVDRDQVSQYGCASVEREAGGLVRVTGVVEKPDPSSAPSNLAVMGRYVLTPEIFDAIDQLTPGQGGELQLTDAIGELIPAGVYGFVFADGRYDTGNKLDYLKTIVEYALVRDDLGPDFLAFLHEVVGR
ncbi:MAG TPA: UTP--glucose-1-phosphate uridylyltransferase, partial [Acidimicrobiales bacterium]|nr:UTP--glucose-1-phosphate uridylyltransferase [Acidimicrobiales bacterium]